MRNSRAAHPLREQRDELLRALPDGWKASRRSSDVTPAEAGLAQVDRRAVARPRVSWSTCARLGGAKRGCELRPHRRKRLAAIARDHGSGDVSCGIGAQEQG